MLEPGETIQVDPSWRNTLTDSQTFTGTASSITGPKGPTYTINNSSADYGTVGGEAAGDCNSATADCYLMTVSGARPAIHWDATFTEDLSSNSISQGADAAPRRKFHGCEHGHRRGPHDPSIETILHKQVSVGCHDGTDSVSNYSTTCQEMAVFNSGRRRRGRASPLRPAPASSRMSRALPGTCFPRLGSRTSTTGASPPAASFRATR